MNKKIIIGIAGVLLLGGIFVQTGHNKSNVAGVSTTVAVPTQATTSTPTLTPTQVPTLTATPTPTTMPTPTVYIAPTTKIYQQTTSTSNSLSNDSYYTNSDGNQVHSPAYSNDNSVPAGASAQCGDGTYSFSQHRSGTCSHHGGVVIWY